MTSCSTPLLALVFGLGLASCTQQDKSEALSGVEARLEQLEAIENATREAEESGDWVRAIAGLEVLLRLDPENPKALEQRLVEGREQRQLSVALLEAEALLDQGAWHSAAMILIDLKRHPLSDSQRDRVDGLTSRGAVLREREPHPIAPSPPGRLGDERPGPPGW